MKLEVNVSKRYFLGILVAVLLLTSAIIAYAATSGFSSTNKKTLAQAKQGGYHTADETIVLAGGQEMTLQDAIDNGNLGGSGALVSSYARTVRVDASQGVYSWRVPTGVTKILVEVWGAGGGASSAGGGGGGGYAQGIVSVSAGETYTASVGAGGTGSTSTGAVGGGESYFSRDSSKLLKALGGGAPTYVPGAGGIAIIASEVVGSAITGSPGGVYSDLFGGKGGDSPNGGNGGPRGSGGVYCSAGLDGFAPGGGGGGTKGGSNYGSCNYMGAGANGLIAIHW